VPSAPVLVQTLDVPGERSWGYGNLGGVSTQSNWMVQQGDHLVFLMVNEENTMGQQAVVVDLSNPNAMAVTATLDRPGAEVQGQLSVMSDTIVSWHTEPVENQPGKVRFYFDRLELDGEPGWAPKINVPGVIVAWDAQAGRAFTVDFSIYDVNLSDEACWNHPKYWQFDGNSCKLIDQTLEQLAIQGNGAMLMRSIDIEGDSRLEQLYATDTRIFAKTGSWAYVNENYTSESSLIVLDTTVANAELVELDGSQLGQWWWFTTVFDDRAIAQSDYGGLALVDASIADQTEIVESNLPGWGGCYSPVIDGDTVYCPMGPYGLEVVDW
jgi:hypothetical protein